MQFPRLIHLFHLIPPVTSDAVKVDGVESDRIKSRRIFVRFNHDIKGKEEVVGKKMLLSYSSQVNSFVAAICQGKIYYVNVELTQHVNSQGGPIHR